MHLGNLLNKCFGGGYTGSLLGFPLVEVSRGYSLVVAWQLLTVVAYCRGEALGAQTSVVKAWDFSSCGCQALEHMLSSCGVQALVAPQHVGSSQIRDRSHVSCNGRWILYQSHQGNPSALFLILKCWVEYFKLKFFKIK